MTHRIATRSRPVTGPNCLRSPPFGPICPVRPLHRVVSTGREMGLMAANTELPATTTPAADSGVPSQVRGWARLCIVVAAVVALFGVVLSTGAGGDGASQTISNVGLCIGAISAAVACLFRARGFTGRMRWGWALVGLGVLSW